METSQQVKVIIIITALFELVEETNYTIKSLLLSNRIARASPSEQQRVTGNFSMSKVVAVNL